MLPKQAWSGCVWIMGFVLAPSWSWLNSTQAQPCYSCFSRPEGELVHIVALQVWLLMTHFSAVEKHGRTYNHTNTHNQAQEHTLTDVWSMCTSSWVWYGTDYSDTHFLSPFLLTLPLPGLPPLSPPLFSTAVQGQAVPPSLSTELQCMRLTWCTLLGCGYLVQQRHSDKAYMVPPSSLALRIWDTHTKNG